MANVKNELAQMQADEFAKNNGIVMRTMLTMFKRGYFKVRELLQTLTAYNISLDEILDALDYFDDRKYIQCQEIETLKTVKLCDCDVESVRIRLTADGKLLGFKLMDDLGISL